MITDQQIIEAGRVLLQARNERGAAGQVPDAVTAALGNITLPTNDVIARGPVSPLTDAEVDQNLAHLNGALAQGQASLGLAKSVLGFFGLGS